MVPPVQFIALPTVTNWPPPRVPLLRFNSVGATVPVPSKLAVPPEMTSALLVQM